MVCLTVDGGGKPIFLEQAISSLRQQLSPVLEKETVPLALARGRVLVENLIAGRDLPPNDMSAVDGYAIRIGDLNSDQVALRLVGETAAGHPFKGVVEAGQAVRILTGAPLPIGADTVVMQEIVAVDGETVVVKNSAIGKNHCRKRGEDVMAASQILPAGLRLRTQDIVLSAAVGYSELPVFRRLRVGLFSTGDELCEPGASLGDGQIWDANRFYLRDLLTRMGCEIRDLGILRDTPRKIEEALVAAAGDVDLLITSGGMSVGSEDHIRSIIKRRGSLDIWPIAIRPGKPVGLGDIDDTPILALPGNPIAAVMTFIAFGRRVLDILSCASEEPPQSILLPAGFTFTKKKGFRQYLLATIASGESGASSAVLLKKQGSAMLSAVMAASGFIPLPEDREYVRHGDLVEFTFLAPFFS